jgi:urease accessory protein
VAEPLIFGRAAMGEEVRKGHFHDRIEIRQGGRPLYRDAMRLDGDIAARLDRPHTANGARALASLVYVAPDSEAQLAAVRSALPATGGASLIGDDVLALRLLAGDGFELRRGLIPILTRLTGGDLPKPWMI